MQRIPVLLLGMFLVAILAASCGSSSDSAMPVAKASPVGSSRATTSSFSSASRSSASRGAPAPVPLFASEIDLARINYDPDGSIPSPTILKTSERAP